MKYCIKPILTLLAILLAVINLSGCRFGRVRFLENRLEHLETVQELRNRETFFTKDSSAADVVRWWEFFRGRAYGLFGKEYRLDRMEPLKVREGFHTYTLHDMKANGKSIRVLLDVPTEAWGENAFQGGEMPSCFKNNSILRAGGDMKGVAADLNPHCSDGYAISEVNIAVFWISPEKYPLIEIVTNGPACVPAYLYSYDRAKGRYVLAKEDCSG
jgi:hypothetical protein